MSSTTPIHEAPEVSPPTQPRRAIRWRLLLPYALVFCFSSTLGVLAVLAGFQIAVTAAYDCGVFYDSGNEFAIGIALLFSIMPAGIVTSGFSLLATRIHPVLGLTSALVLSASVLLFVVVTHAYGTAAIEHSALVGPELCPSGIPPWWPSWLPH